jgi:FAD-dependent sensor of blue light
MDSLIHLIYASTATRPFDKEQLVELLEQSRGANARIDVSGMLLHEAGNFFQVLEGRAAVVEALFAKICADDRHERPIKIMQEPIAERSFGDWTMAFSDITRAELDAIDGTNDFFGRGLMFVQMGNGRAKKLVAAFGQGRWRSKIVPRVTKAATQACSCPPH